MTTPAAPPPRIAARAVLRVTAACWGLDLATRAQPAARALAASGPDTACRAGCRTSARNGDIVPARWPYWPAYPGLAAGWR